MIIKQKQKNALILKTILVGLGLLAVLATPTVGFSADAVQGANELESQFLKALSDDDKNALIKNPSSNTIVGERINKIYDSPKTITGRKLVQEYDKNEVKADMDYKGKWLIVTAKVSNIGKTLGESNLQLEGTNPYLPMVAFFKGARIKADELNQKLAKIQKGRNVTLLCKGAGMAVTPSLKQCMFFSDAVNDAADKMLDNWLLSFKKVIPENAPIVFMTTYMTEKMTEKEKAACLKKAQDCLKAAKYIKNKMKKPEIPARYLELGYTKDMLKGKEEKK